MAEQIPQEKAEQAECISIENNIGPQLGGWAVEHAHAQPASRTKITEFLSQRREKISEYQHNVEDASPAHIAERLLEIITESGVRESVSSGKYNPAELNGIIGEMGEIKNHAISLLNNSSPEEAFPTAHIKTLSREPLYLLKEVPGLTLREAYFSASKEDNSAIKNALAEAIVRNEGIKSLELTADVLSKVYGNLPIKKLAENEVAGDDPRVKALAQHPAFDELLIHNIGKGFEEGQTNAERTARSYREAGKLLTNKFGLPADLSGEFVSALEYRNKKDIEADGDNAERDIPRLQTSLLKAKANIETLGADEIVNIRRACGIVNLDGYTPAQLQRMARIIEDDPAAIEHIQAGDSTVYLTDAKGDHNGAYAGGRKWEGESGRALFFEIIRPSDFYRHMLFLQKRGIKPSTVIVNAHGQPGKMGFGDEAQRRFRVGNGYTGADFSLPEAVGIKRLAEDFMQNSRGIDDDEASVGRRKLLLLSCSQAQLTSSLDVDEQGNFKTRIHKSTADTIAQTANVPNLDIYAPQRPVGIQESADKTGLIFLENAQSKNQVPASKITCQADGKITTTFVDEIPLRRN